MSNITIDVMIAYLLGVISSGLVFYYFYIKLYSLKENLKERALEYYYENKSLKSFEELADKTLKNSSQNIVETSYKSLNLLLQPFQNDLKEFNNEIKTYYISEAKERFALKSELKDLQNLNYKLLNESSRLTNALKSDNKFAGSWGEFVLESVLESSGLREGYEYEKQVEFRKEDIKLRPDIVVHLPKKRDIIIDSKVSLKAYERYVNDNDKEALKEHIDSIKNHIINLSKKEYHTLIDSIDLVLLFIPIEGAYIESLKYHKELFEFAYKKNILLVSPTTLITVLKTIEYSWKKEFQNKNAKAITQKAKKLHDKFINFLSDMQTVETSIKKAEEAYEKAYKKLYSGNANLIKQAKELKELEDIFNA